VEDFKSLGIIVSKKSYQHLKLSPMRPNELWTCPDDGAARAQAPGFNIVLLSCGSVRRGRGGDWYTIVSDVVKVEGEDPATPGYYLRSVDTRKPRDRNDSPISG